ncbi:MAG TPA: hypothetical protein VFF33_15000 [Ignavibacteriaceae bacterium]|nr:hypothetical protein [Ignavibacteriaceae bacterium]
MRKYIFLFFILFTALVTAQPQFSKISSSPGAFSRMGFGARGMGMGNSMSAVTYGNLVSYYNPALSAFQEKNAFQTSYSILSLDRSLNFLNFTRRFDFYSSSDTSANKKPRSSAGISLGIINSGVSGIEVRDNQGMKSDVVSTSENQFFIGLANRFSEKFSLGIAIKFYYFKLYEEINSTGFGIDLGALYRINDKFNLSFMLTDLNSKYKWDSSPIYKEEGSAPEDKFPLIKKIGFSYRDEKSGVLASVELEASNKETNIFRFGIEYNIFTDLYLRGGIDQINLKNKDFPVEPSLGFSFFRSFNNIRIGVDYAFVVEQYSPTDRHIVGLNVTF